MSKKYTWSFTGQVHAQGKRKKMIDQLKDCPGDSFFNINESWQSQDSLDTKDYKDILSNSVFVPCPKGNSSVDSFRLYECLECGAIPIIEKDASWEILLGDHPFLLTDSDWVAGKKYIQELYGKNDFLQKYQDKIQDWWAKFKISLKEDIKSKITHVDYGKPCLFNPTTIKHKDIEYTLFRKERYPNQSPSKWKNSQGKIIDFERSLFGYQLEKKEGNKQSSFNCVFHFGEESYETIRSVDLDGSMLKKLEDIKFVQNTVQEKNGGVFCLATANGIVQTKITNGTKKANQEWDKDKKLNLALSVTPCFCEVDLINGDIRFIDMIGREKNVSRQVSYEKNWAVIKHEGIFYCFYSIDPLIYKKSESLSNIVFDKNTFGKNIEYHFSCNPVFYNGRYYVFGHKRKNKDRHFVLEKTLLSFEIIDGEVVSVEKNCLNFNDDCYVSSFEINDSEIKIHAGHGDVESKKISIPNPRTNSLEHLKFSNPSAIKHKNIYYAVFRGEDFSGQIEDIENGKLGVVQSLIYTKGSYWMKTLDSDFRVLGSDRLSFVYKGDRYKDYYRKDAEQGTAVFEDVRIIDQSVFIDDQGDVCCYATCSMLTDSFWHGFPPYQPGLCKVNFSRKEIVFVKMLTEIEKGGSSHKNWMCVYGDKGVFTIASMFPLAYQFSPNKEFGIRNKSIVSIAENVDYRNSCQPVKLEKNKYGMLCHKKNGTKYEYIWVEFLVNGGSLEILSRKKIHMPHKNAYCSGVVVDSKRQAVMCFAGINNFSYEIYDLEIKIEETLDRDQRLEIKKKELINMKTLWPGLVQRDSLKYLSELFSEEQAESEDFSIYNAGKEIAIISLYTDEISDYAVYSEKNIKDYCYEQGYTFYVYRQSLDTTSSPNWSKARAILNHINDHKDIVWMDSDTLIFNPKKKFESILSKCSSTKKIIACEDIGTNNKNMPKGSMFNSGVLIFRNHEYTKNIIKEWMNFEGDKSSLYASGGDQEILCNILRKVDGFGYNRKIFPMNEFNTEPRMINHETFIVHFMAFPCELKKLFMMYFVSS
jgi:hypothetical protein